MFKHKSRHEGVLYEEPNTRSKINDEVREELAGTETFSTDTQGLRLAYESPDRIYGNGSILYIAGTKDPIDFWDDLKLPFIKQETQKDIKMSINSFKTMLLKLMVKNITVLLIL